MNTDFVRGENLDLDLRLVTSSDRPVVLDVGANEGQTVEKIRKNFRNPTVHCFEPNPDAFRILSDQYCHDSQVIVNQEAVASKRGYMEFKVCEADSKLSSALSLSENTNSPFAKYKQTSIKVLSQKIDDYLSKIEYRKDNKFVLKLDIQGFELEALRGASDSLEKQTFTAIWAELAFSPIYETQVSAGNLIDYLSSFGYIPTGFYNVSRVGKPNRQPHGIDWCDALFVPVSSLAKVR